MTGNESQRQSYVTTDGQSASLSRCQAPIWGPKPDFYCCQTIVGLLMCGALYDERTGPSFTIPAVPCQHSHSRVRVRGSLRLESPPTWRIWSPYLYPLGTGWSSYTPRHCIPPTVACDSQGYSGNSSPPPRGESPARIRNDSCSSLYILGTDRTGNAACNTSSILVRVRCLAMVMILLCLHSRYLAMVTSLSLLFLLCANVLYLDNFK
jgi:hypothetical protein